MTAITLSYLGTIPSAECDFPLLEEIASEELHLHEGPFLHTVIHSSEIPDIILKVKEALRRFVYIPHYNDKYLGVSIVGNLPEHIDEQVPENQSFLLLVVYTKGDCILYSEDKEFLLKKGDVYYLDPHRKHGVRVSGRDDYAYIVRVPVIKNPPK